MSRFLAVLVPIGAVATLLSGCLAAAAGYAGAKLAEDDATYVCRDAPTAPSARALRQKLTGGDSTSTSHAGDRVDIRERQEVSVDGRSRTLTFVSVHDSSRTYWVPYEALCNR